MKEDAFPKLFDGGQPLDISGEICAIDGELDFIDDVVDELDSRDELNYIHEILERGSGADRQLRVFQETGDLKKVVDYIIEETEAGLGLKEEAAAVTKTA